MIRRIRNSLRAQKAFGWSIVGTQVGGSMEALTPTQRLGVTTALVAAAIAERYHATRHLTDANGESMAAFETGFTAVAKTAMAAGSWALSGVAKVENQSFMETCDTMLVAGIGGAVVWASCVFQSVRNAFMTEEAAVMTRQQQRPNLTVV